jgi:dihydrolipoamide dehydrogenase
MVGEGVSEMIQGFTLAMQMETTEQEIIETVFPHPTISESMQEAVMMAYGRALNL